MHGFVGSAPRRGRTDQRSRDMLERIAEALGVDVDWFLANPSPPPSSSPQERSAQLQRIAAAFSRIEDPDVREAVVGFVESRAGLELDGRSRDGCTR